MKKAKNFVIKTILLTVLMFIGVSCLSVFLIKTYESQKFPVDYTALFDIKRNLKSKNYNTVFIGDSSLRRGIDAKYFAKLYGKSSYNLALNAFASPISYRILMDQYLHNNKKPSNLIIYFSASSPYHFKKNHFEKTYTLVRYADFKTILKELSFSDIIMTGKTIISIYVKTYLKLITFSYKDLEKNLIERNGFEPSPNGQLKGKEVFSSFKNQKLYLNYLLDLKNYYQSLGINVILYVAPVTYYEKGFEQFSNIYNNIVYNKLINLDNSYFTDYTHMTEDGAYKNTLRVYNELSQALK